MPKTLSFPNRRATPAFLIPLLALALLFTLAPAADAKIPTLRSRFSNIPCLAPLIRAVDPNAPKSIEEAFLLPPHQGATILDDVGSASFPITTESEQAQAFFNQGIALLHAFWYSEADRSFRQALSLDAECPMIYWGLAMANERFPNRASIFTRRALYHLPKRPETTPREKAWLKILTAYYKPEVADPANPVPQEEWDARGRERIQALENLALAYPEEIEPKAFLLRQLTLDEFRSGIALTSHYTADLLAETIHTANPQHPSRHYRSFLWLNQNPLHAIISAPEAPTIAPRIPNLWNYSAQAFSAARRFQEALLHQRICLRVSHDFMRRAISMPDETENLASDYTALIDLLASTGRAREAVETARAMIALPRTAYLGERDTFDQSQAGTYATGRRLLAETLMRHERWEQLLEECESGALSAQESDWTHAAHAHYWRAIANLNLDRAEDAAKAEEALNAHFRNFLRHGTTIEVEKDIARCIRGLRAYRGLYNKELSGAPDTSREPLPHITPDHLSRLLVRAGFNHEGLTLAAQDLEARPGQPLAVANYCGLHYAAGKTNEALLAFDSDFRRNAGLADPGLASFEGLAPIVKKLNFRSNWKLPPHETVRPEGFPDAESLGPLTWEPPVAPPWSLPDHTGKTHSLESYEGQPVMVIFFLGVGCVFCVEQLNVFKPHTETFKEAGIPIIAISTDSVETLQKSLGGEDENTTGEEAAEPPAFPFPVVSNADLATFKAYRAFADFEEKGMHATFLISPAGKILWHDVGHEPFLHPEFLLAESQRLLELHGKK